MSKLAIVFAGGGGKGAYQIGVWKALKEFGVDRNIGAISGTSVGALNAAAFVQGDYELAERIWMNISHSEILKVDALKWLPSFAKSYGSRLNVTVLDIFLKNRLAFGIFSRKGLEQIVDEYIDLNTVSSSNIKCYITCCHWPSKQAVYFDVAGASKDRIKSLLLASSALPIIYEAETIDNISYIDGGLVDNVPVSPLYQEGYRNFLVVHLSRDSLIRTEKFLGANIIQIVPKLHQGTLIDGTLDFNSSNAINRIEQGYEDTKQILQPLYEMGMVQEEIMQAIQRMKKDNQQFAAKREEILSERQELKKELEEVLNSGWTNIGSAAEDK